MRHSPIDASMRYSYEAVTRDQKSKSAVTDTLLCASGRDLVGILQSPQGLFSRLILSALYYSARYAGVLLYLLLDCK